MMSIARPLGCQGFESGRTPPISAIWGNLALTARAATMVLALQPGLRCDADGQRLRDVYDGSREGRAARRASRRRRSAERAHSGADACGVDHRLLLRCQRRVLRLRGRDLTQQFTPLGLQVGAHRGGLLGRGAGVGSRCLRRLGGGGRTVTS